jgi:aspartate/methionine/tyrosine aminotransferase
VRGAGIALISDEIYHGLQYDGPAVSALEVTDEVYVINSFSKYFSMTGWRLGWMVVPPDHVRRVERLAQNMFICPAHASQVAALGRSAPRGAPNWMSIASHMPGIARFCWRDLQRPG